LDKRRVALIKETLSLRIPTKFLIFFEFEEGRPINSLFLSLPVMEEVEREREGKREYEGGRRRVMAES